MDVARHRKRPRVGLVTRVRPARYRPPKACDTTELGRIEMVRPFPVRLDDVLKPALVALCSVVAAGVILVADGQTNRAEAATCSAATLKGKARGLGKERAKKKARQAWERSARRIHRTSRANWWNATDRRYSCWYIGFRTECTAWARACY